MKGIPTATTKKIAMSRMLLNVPKLAPPWISV